MRPYDIKPISAKRLRDSLANQKQELKYILDSLRIRNISVKTMYNLGVGPQPHQEASLIKKEIPDIKIYGVEPNPITYFDRLSGYPGVLLPLGVWSEEKILKLQIESDHGRSSYLDPGEAWSMDHNVEIKHKAETLCKTLDSLDTLFGRPEDIILWMDIEGSELEALKGAHKLLESGRIGAIFLECTREDHQRRLGEPTVKEIRTFLEDYNFQVDRSHDPGRARKFVNLLFHKAA